MRYEKENKSGYFVWFWDYDFHFNPESPSFWGPSCKTKSNIAQVETQALHNIDKPVIDVSGWQRPEEINYDTLSQNISGAIVRVHSGAQTSKENDASYVNGVDKAFKTHITEFQNEMSQLVSMPM